MAVVLGRVLGAFQGTNHYEVITDFGRLTGIYHGVSRGLAGVLEAGSITPNSFVWITWGEAEPFGQILGVALPIWPISQSANDPTQSLTSPQVAGFADNERLSGRLYRGVPGLQRRPTGVGTDLVNGEWGMFSPHGLGGGVGVELFRSFVQGGPMSGLWCWHDTQLTRLAGLNFEFRTLAQDDYDRVLGNVLVQSRSRVFYPSEALQDLLPRELELQGAVHGGRQRFVAPAGPRGTSRPALFHEHIATDGSYRLTSARSVVIERYCGIQVPEESVAADDDQPLNDQPLDTPELRETAVTTPRPTLHGRAGGLAWVQQSIDLIESLTAKGRGAVERLPGQWPIQQQVAGVPTDCFHTTYTPGMWRRQPQSFEITIDPIEKERTFYVGRSSVTLLPDGSVVIEDASHSQIVMSGGSIMLSCPNDIVLAPGRNLVAIAGSDICLRANRHLDACANEGRMSLKAEGLLQLTGGNGGDGGVLLESRAIDPLSVPVPGVGQKIGGLYLKSATHLTATAETVVGLKSRENILFEAKENLFSKAAQTFLDTKGGLLVDTGKTYALTGTGMVVPASLIVDGQATVKGLYSNGQIIAQGSIAATGAVVGGGGVGQGKVTIPASTDTLIAANITITAKAVVAVKAEVKRLLNLDTPMKIGDNLGFSFARSYELGHDFELPETRWQSVARGGDGDGNSFWAENAVPLPDGAGGFPTSALPGYEIWVMSPAVLRRDTLHPFFNLKNGESLRPASAVLADNPLTTINGNWLINGG